MPRQGRSQDEQAGRRFKRRKRRRGKRGAVSQKRGRDKAVEGKDRQFRDRKEERPGDRKGKKFQRSRKRRPARRERRQGGDREKRDFRPQTGRPGDQRGPARQNLGGIRDEINQIKSRREQFSQRKPEQVAEDRGFDPSRLQDFREGGRFQPQPAPAPEGDIRTLPGEPMPAPQPGVQIGPDGRVVQPAPIRQEVPPQAGGDFVNGAGIVPGQPGGDAAGVVAGQPQPGQEGGGFTPLDHPGPTAPPGVATDAYGKPAQPGSGPYAPQPAPAPEPDRFQPQPFPAPQMNPRAAGMQRFAQPPQRRPEDQYPVR